MIKKLDISATGDLELSEDLKKYVQKKIGRLDRFLSRHARKTAHADVKLRGHTAKKNNKFTAEVVLHLPNETLTAKESTMNIFAGVDIVEAKIQNQLRKYKDKNSHEGGIRRKFKRATKGFGFKR